MKRLRTLLSLPFFFLAWILVHIAVWIEDDDASLLRQRQLRNRIFR